MPSPISTQETHTYSFPTTIRFGAGVISELGCHLLERKLTRPLIVTDPTCATLPFFRKIIKALENERLHPTVYNDLQSNPTESDVSNGVTAFHGNDCDAIVGIGGGVSMDVARTIALMAHHPGSLFEYEDAADGSKKVTEKIPYFVCAPTTSGTGSEVGRSAIIADDTTKEKKIIFSPRLLAKCVYADPELTYDLPPCITAATGLDALTHSIEAYLAKGHHPICDGIALEAIRLINHSLEATVLHSNPESRANMLLASLMGGIAFQKGLGIVHSLAHPISTVYNTHHGLANAIMLPYGVAFNQKVVPDRIATISTLLGTEDLVATLQDLNRKLSLPTKLREIGVEQGGLKRLSKLAVLDVCHQCNPHPVTQDDFYKIYEGAL